MTSATGFGINQPPKLKTKPANKKLSGLFNFAAGFGAAMAAKALFGVCAASFGAPVLVLAIGAGMMGGLARSYASHAYKNYSRRQNGEQELSYTWSEAGKAVVFGAVGGGLGATFFDSLMDIFFGSASCTPPAPLAASAPVADFIPDVVEQGPVAVSPEPFYEELPAKTALATAPEPAFEAPKATLRLVSVEDIPAAPDSIIMRDGEVFTADYNGPHETMETNWASTPAVEPQPVETISQPLSEITPAEVPVTTNVASVTVEKTTDFMDEPPRTETLSATEPAVEEPPIEDTIDDNEELVVYEGPLIQPTCDAVIGDTITFVCEVDKNDPMFRPGNTVNMIAPPILTMALQ